MTLSSRVMPSTCWPICRASGVVEWNASSAQSKPASSWALATVSMCVGSRTGPDRTMVSEELLFEMNPMNSTDMVWLQFGESSQAEREAAGGDSGGVVLRGMDAPAHDVAIVPLQRI